jgi:hypothetical protein
MLIEQPVERHHLRTFALGCAGIERAAASVLEVLDDIRRIDDGGPIVIFDYGQLAVRGI